MSDASERALYDATWEELRWLRDQDIAALLPALTPRADPLVWYVSTAGDGRGRGALAGHDR